MLPSVLYHTFSRSSDNQCHFGYTQKPTYLDALHVRYIFARLTGPLLVGGSQRTVCFNSNTVVPAWWRVAELQRGRVHEGSQFCRSCCCKTQPEVHPMQRSARCLGQTSSSELPFYVVRVSAECHFKNLPDVRSQCIGGDRDVQAKYLL